MVWTDKKNYLIHYRLLKFCFGHGTIVDDGHEMTSFRQRKWLENCIFFDKQKKTLAKNDFETDFYKPLNICIYRKTMRNVRNRKK